MSELERFQAYADAFEETYVDDNWSRLEAYFADDAEYDPGDGIKSVGRDAVIARLRDAVNGLDRRFDSRILDAEAPTLDGNTVSLKWNMTLRKAGAPDLNLSGVEKVSYADGAIKSMQDVFDEGTVEALHGWMAAHGDSLES